MLNHKSITRLDSYVTSVIDEIRRVGDSVHRFMLRYAQVIR